VRAIGGTELKLLCVSCSRSQCKASVCSRSLAGIVGSNPAGGMDVCCECCVLSGRVLCVGLITRPEETYRMWCVRSRSVDNDEALAHWGLLCYGGGEVTSCQ